MIATAESAQAAREADAKLHGLPLKGTHIGGGLHYDIPDKPPGPGWTVNVYPVEADGSVKVSEELERAIVEAKAEVASGSKDAEKQKLASISVVTDKVVTK